MSHRTTGEKWSCKTAAHTVELDEMLIWIESSYVTAASSSEEPKLLEVKMSGGYRVTVRDAVVYEGTDGRSAVNAYNEAT